MKMASRIVWVVLFWLGTVVWLPGFGAEGPPPKAAAVRIIFDTDIGNDVDDVLALAMLHAFETRGDCQLLAVTVTKRDELAGPFVDVINCFYGRPEIPIGCIRPAKTNDSGKFLPLVNVKDGDRLRYPHALRRGSDAPEAVGLLRRVLSEQPDGSVVLVQVGFFSNLATLLGTGADGHSQLSGRELVQRKVKLLSVMAGSFRNTDRSKHFGEFNVGGDLAAARKVAQDWPTPIVWSGHEIGVAVPYPARSIERDFGYVAHHPVAEAYYLYNPPPHERPTWDLTAVLYAVMPDRDYFGLSSPGRVTVEPDGVTRFAAEAGGRDRFLTLAPDRVDRVKEALVLLSSEPPGCPGR